jgi:hypothetical protein
MPNATMGWPVNSLIAHPLCPFFLLFYADLDFLQMFSAAEGTDPNILKIEEDAVLGQPAVAAAYQAAPANMTLPVQPQQQPVDMQTMQMPSGVVTQAYLPAAPTTLPANAVVALQQQYTQAILQQHMLAQAQANTTERSIPPVNKRGKSSAQIAEQQERVKQRRRESAQRSRQRKSSYMKSLEAENYALKLENARLRKEMETLGHLAPPRFNPIVASGSSADIPTEHQPLTCTTSSDEGLCPADMSGFGSGTAQELMGMAI